MATAPSSEATPARTERSDKEDDGGGGTMRRFSTTSMESLRRPLPFEPGFSTSTTAFRSKARNWDDGSEGGEQVASTFGQTAPHEPMVDQCDTCAQPTPEPWSERSKRAMFLVVWLSLQVFLAAATWNSWEETQDWCHGIKFLLVSVLALHLFAGDVLLKAAGLWEFVERFKERLAASFYAMRLPERCTMFWAKGVFFGVSYSALVGFIAYDSAPKLDGLLSFGGLLLFTCMSCLFSKSPRHIPWDCVLSGVLLQYLLALVLLRSEMGRRMMQCLSSHARNLMTFSNFGARFVFGYLVDGKIAGVDQKQPIIYVFTMLPSVVVFGFLINLMFYYKVAQWIIVRVGCIVYHIIGTTACESVAAIVNIFLGMCEATLMIRPYVSRMTNSELHCTMTVGFATISSGVFNAFAELEVDPLHIMASSILSATAGLVAAKLWYPETEVSVTHYAVIDTFKSPESSALEAAAVGITSVVTLLPIIAANLVVCISFISFSDDVMQHLGDLVGFHSFNIRELVAVAFFPGALAMGIDKSEIRRLARLLSKKTVENEFLGFVSFHKQSANSALSERTRIVATYALCGFSNLSSFGVQLGALGAVAPSRIGDLTDVAFRALVAGFVACFCTACIVGSIITSRMNPAVAKFNATEFL